MRSIDESLPVLGAVVGDHGRDQSFALLTMSLAAALVPALHATSVDPAKTLRED